MFRVAIFDDEYLEREVLRRILADMEGVQVVAEGKSGRMAVELCTVLKPDLAILNCHMGEMSGLQAAKQIRSVHKDMALFLTSADGRFPIRCDLEAIMIQEFLLKPIRPDRIFELVGLYQRRTGAGAYAPNGRVKEPGHTPPSALSREILGALRYMDAHYRDSLSLEQVADAIYLSRHYFSRLFKKEVGATFSDYLLRKRLQEAKRLLAETELALSDISVSIGFKDQSYFCKVFKKHAGNTPMEYRKHCMKEQKDRKRIKDQYVHAQKT